METTFPLLFFLDGDLHKRLKIAKVDNMLVAWNYPKEDTRHYIYSDVLRNYQQAFTIKEASALIKRPVREIELFLKNKVLDKPSGFEYHVNSRRPKGYVWSEDDMLDLRDRFHELAPKDNYGYVKSTFKLASRAELLVSLKSHGGYTVVDGQGKTVRVWRS